MKTRTFTVLRIFDRGGNATHHTLCEGTENYTRENFSDVHDYIAITITYDETKIKIYQNKVDIWCVETKTPKTGEIYADYLDNYIKSNPNYSVTVKFAHNSHGEVSFTYQKIKINSVVEL